MKTIDQIVAEATDQDARRKAIQEEHEALCLAIVESHAVHKVGDIVNLEKAKHEIAYYKEREGKRVRITSVTGRVSRGFRDDYRVCIRYVGVLEKKDGSFGTREHEWTDYLN